MLFVSVPIPSFTLSFVSQVSFRSLEVQTRNVCLNGRLSVMWSRWIRALRHELTASFRKHTATHTHSTSWSMTTPTGTLTGLFGVCEKENQKENQKEIRSDADVMQNDHFKDSVHLLLFHQHSLVQQEHHQSSHSESLSLSHFLIQCILQQLRQQFGSGGPAVKLPTGQRCSKHPNSPRHVLPLRSADTVYSHQPLQRDPLAFCIQ